MFNAIKTIEEFSSPPDSAGSARAFSRIGYSLAEALADLIDNSIDASATRIEITFFRNDDAITAVTIADDGRGMAEPVLKRAMQFASTAVHKASDLGTFGLGMKSASLSQCRSLTVISRHKGSVAACRWTVEAIKDDWRCEILDPAAATAAFADGFSHKTCPRENGTVVIWDRLDRLATGTGTGDLDEFLGKIVSRLETRLGLVFHRFLRTPSFCIILRTRHEARLTVLPRAIRPLDPFPHAISGKIGYPKTFHATLPGAGAIVLQAHIWPAGSASPEFLLGRRSATPHQGFYFYRNDRLIQAGGWNDVLPDANDPELSLARVAVDLPADGTSTNVQKSAIQVSAALSQALNQARSGSASLTDYLDDARKAFLLDKRRQRPNAYAPVVLGAGVPAKLRRRVRSLVAKKGVVREIDFVWRSLSKTKVFELDRAEDQIVLNKKYRQQILTGMRASSADAALVKSLFFLLLQDDFDRARFSAKRLDWIERCNAILLEAVKTL